MGIYQDVFRIKSNIYDGAFEQKQLVASSSSLFSEKAPSHTLGTILNASCYMKKIKSHSLHKKISFSLKISLVNVIKSAGNCEFNHIY